MGNPPWATRFFVLIWDEQLFKFFLLMGWTTIFFMLMAERGVKLRIRPGHKTQDSPRGVKLRNRPGHQKL